MCLSVCLCVCTHRPLSMFYFVCVCLCVCVCVSCRARSSVHQLLSDVSGLSLDICKAFPGVNYFALFKRKSDDDTPMRRAAGGLEQVINTTSLRRNHFASECQHMVICLCHRFLSSLGCVCVCVCVCVSLSLTN